jgi:pimeloyl-ACP methyl ester carboxylesterase
MSAILLDTGIVHYEVIGRGRPIIFVHGWVGSWRYWMSALQAASTSYRAYALDLWGFGETAREPDHYGVDKQIELLDHFLNEMGIGRVALVGHGLGGVVSLLYASRFPNIVDRVMAVSCPLEFNSLNQRLRSAAPAELAEWLLARTPDADAARTDAAKADPRALAASFENPDSFNLGSRFYMGKTPVLLVYGQTDPAVNVPQFDPLLMPEMLHSIYLDQSGHFPMLDEPQRFNRLLTDWLALESGESPRDLQLKEEWRRRVR